MRSALFSVAPVAPVAPVALLALLFMSLAASACATVPDLYFGAEEDAEARDASIAEGGDAAPVDAAIADTSISDTSIADVADTSIPPGVVSIAQAAKLVDRVGMADAALTPDGAPDGIFDVTFEGPLTALVLLATDASGAPDKVNEWDTLVGTDPIASSLGANYTQGSQTWILGVFDGATRVNGADGRFALGAGARTVTVAAADGGRFKAGAHFVLNARLGDAVTWVKSNVVAWK